jgi:hypothetical protein
MENGMEFKDYKEIVDKMNKIQTYFNLFTIKGAKIRISNNLQ